MDETNLVLACQIPYGKSAIIRKIESSIDKDFALRLREIGFGEGKVISKYSDDGNINCILLGIDGRKVMVSENGAHSIFVELLQ